MPEKIIKIVLISNSKLFLEGLRKILANEEGLEIAGECNRLKDLDSIFKESSPEVLFIDNRELKWDIGKLFKGNKYGKNKVMIILFSEGVREESNNPDFVTVNHDTTASELIAIIEGAREGNNNMAAAVPVDSDVQSLTNMELKIIGLIASGKNNKEISDKLSISEKTVKAHLSNIFQKLNMKNRYQLMVFGKRIQNNTEMSI
jgi:DNA-binding NarL/FixJ family response regulator